MAACRFSEAGLSCCIPNRTLHILFVKMMSFNFTIKRISRAIYFSMHIDKEENPAGDRVVITMNGKFLLYKTW